MQLTHDLSWLAFSDFVSGTVYICLNSVKLLTNFTKASILKGDTIRVLENV